MRRVLSFALLFVVLLGLLAGPIVAEERTEDPRWDARSYSLVGEVTAVDAAGGTVTVKVLSGNALVRQFIGQEKPLVVAVTTRFWPPEITLGTLAIGSMIRSTGSYHDPVLSAALIVVLPGPERFELRGEVTAVLGPVISVRVRAGGALVRPYVGDGPLSLMTDGLTQFAPRGTSLATIAPGRAIVASGIYTEGQFLARNVVLIPEHKPKPFELVGVVTAVDAHAGTLSVRVLKGNAVVKPYFGTEVRISVTAGTRYLPPTTKLAELKGAGVKVQGVYTDSTFIGQKITVTSDKPKGLAGKKPKASMGPKPNDPGGDKAEVKDKGNGHGKRGAAPAPRGKSAPGRIKSRK